MKGIYLIENTKLYEKYIGSSYKIHSRWGTHIRNLIKKEHHSLQLQKSFNNSSISDFKFSILEIVPNETSDRELEIKESNWSSLFKGYINRLPLSKDGKVNFNHTKETILNILKTQNRYKPFYALNLKKEVIGEYELLEDARKDLNICVSSIRLSLKSGNFTKKSVGFIYKNDLGLKELKVCKAYNFGTKTKNLKRKRIAIEVYNIYGEYFKTFESINECADYFKVPVPNLFKTLNLFPKKILCKGEISKYIFIKSSLENKDELIKQWFEKYKKIKEKIVNINGDIIIKDLYNNIIGKNFIQNIASILEVSIPTLKEVLKGNRIQCKGFKLEKI